MSSRRLRTKYKANRNRRRIEKFKAVSKYLVAGVVVVVLMWLLIPNIEHGCSQPLPKMIRLGGD